MHKQIHPKSLYWGNTVILLNTIDATGSTNITPISSSWALSKNIVIGLSLNIKAVENIEFCPEVVLNIPSVYLADKVESIAKYTGKQPVPPEKLKSGFSYCEDKFLTGGFTAQPSQTVRPLRIQECPLQVECLVENIIKRENHAIVELKATYIHAEENLLKDGDIIDAHQWKPLINNFRSYHGITESVGNNFRFEN